MSTITYRGGRDSTFFLASTSVILRRWHIKYPLAGNNHFDSTTKYFSDGQFFPFGWVFFNDDERKASCITMIIIIILWRAAPFAAWTLPPPIPRPTVTRSCHRCSRRFLLLLLVQTFYLIFPTYRLRQRDWEKWEEPFILSRIRFFVKSNRFRFFFFFNQISRSWKCVFCSISCRQWRATKGIMDRHPQYAKPSR